MQRRTALFLPILAMAPAWGLELERIGNLSFGTVLPGDGTGNLTLDPEGKPGPEGLDIAPGSARGPAVLQVQGPAHQPFTVEFDPDPGIPWQPAALEVGNFKAAVFPVGQGLVFDGNGKARLQVGATLKVPARAGSGTLPPHQVGVKLTCGGVVKKSTIQLEGRIMQPLKARQVEIISFGTILVPERDALVTLDPDTGARAFTGASPQVKAGRIPAPGRFALDGEPLEQVTITLPEADKAVYLKGPGEPIEVFNFTTSPSRGLALDGGGKAEVKVGASLKLKAQQKAGSYRGTYTIVFAYP